jgi:linoleoyl-CoA desaturase
MNLPPLRFARENLQFHRELTRTTQAWLDRNGDHRFADAAMIAKAILLALLAGACCWLGLQQTHWLAWAACQAGFSFFAMLLAINVVHDASHQAFFKSRGANRWLSALATIPLGLDPECWRVRHVLMHHSGNNVIGYDPDMEENGILRQSRFQRLRPLMRYQRYYWPLVAALTFPYYIWLFDWLDRAGQTRVGAKMRLQGIRGWAAFMLVKLGHGLLALGLPLWLMSPLFGVGTVIGVYLLCQMMASLIFVMLIIGTHWAKGNSYQPTEQGKLPHSRYSHLFATTCDWLTRPRWLGYWLGGINLHLTHHLFPHWSHRHYPVLAVMIAQVAARYGYDYQCLNLTQLLSSQQQFLQQLGEEDAEH